MNAKKLQLLIPVENQVRELDPKLLLACVAATRGFSSVIGSRRELEFRIDTYPRSIYLSKSMTGRSWVKKNDRRGNIQRPKCCIIPKAFPVGLANNSAAHRSLAHELA